MPHEKEKKRERGMQFRVALRMLMLPVFAQSTTRTSENSLPGLYGSASGISLARDKRVTIAAEK